MEKTDYRKILKDHGFNTTVTNFGMIVGLTPHHLRCLYNTDRERFFMLLDGAIVKWNLLTAGKK